MEEVIDTEVLQSLPSPWTFEKYLDNRSQGTWGIVISNPIIPSDNWKHLHDMTVSTNFCVSQQLLNFRQ